MTYAVISLGGKQYRVQEGERLLVDRLEHAEGKTFKPDILLLGGDGNADLTPKGATVTARVVSHQFGEKIRIGKYKAKSGYRKHTGFRSRLSQIEIESIAGRAAAKKPAAEEKSSASKPKAAKPKAPARKAAAKKEAATDGS
ncbi:MAG: 50S ribosomal protein L21 [Gaiellaceae bacterium]